MDCSEDASVLAHGIGRPFLELCRERREKNYFTAETESRA